MHAARRGQHARAAEPVGGDQLAGELLGGRLGRRRCSRSGARACRRASRISSVTAPCRASRGRKILDDGAGRRIGGGRLIGRHRRVGPGAAMHAVGGRRREQHRIARRRRAKLAQARDVVEHPERAAVRRDDQIVVVDSQVAHRGMRQIELQRLPVLAVVVGDPHGFLGGGEKQPPAAGVLAHGVHGSIRPGDPPRSIASSCRRRGCGRDTGADRRSRRRLTDDIGVSASKCEASICVTLLQGVSPGGVTSAQCAPPSRVTQTRPSSVPAHSVSMLFDDGAERVDRRRAALRRPWDACVPTLAGSRARLARQVGADRGQVMPPSLVFAQPVGRVVESVRIERREQQRLRAVDAHVRVRARGSA